VYALFTVLTLFKWKKKCIYEWNLLVKYMTGQKKQ